MTCSPNQLYPLLIPAHVPKMSPVVKGGTGNQNTGHLSKRGSAIRERHPDQVVLIKKISLVIQNKDTYHVLNVPVHSTNT
jgi:hypothetical protein